MILGTLRAVLGAIYTRLRGAVVPGDPEVVEYDVVIRQAFYEQATVLQAVDVVAQVTADVVFTARLRVAMEVTASIQQTVSYEMER